MRRNYKLFVEDILNAIDNIKDYIGDLDHKAFIKKKIVTDAVIRNLEVIGEAAKNIPQYIRKRYSEIPWARMIGLRNITIHEYFGVDLDIIWEIVTKNLPEIRPIIQKILKNLD